MCFDLKCSNSFMHFIEKAQQDFVRFNAERDNDFVLEDNLQCWKEKCIRNF